MADLVVDTNSWLTVADADDYFRTRLGAEDLWNDETSKEAALITAYKQLNMTKLFSGFPSTATQVMKDAQCEQALFLIVHANDIIRRKGLQAQGVTSAGIVKEQYDKATRGKVVIADEALALLDAYYVRDEEAMYAIDLERDDSEDVL